MILKRLASWKTITYSHPYHVCRMQYIIDDCMNHGPGQETNGVESMAIERV